MTTYVTCGSLIDGSGAPPCHEAVLEVDGARIARVGTRVSIPIPPDVEHLDLGSYTVLPGLIECHDHLSVDFNGGEDAWGGSEAYLAVKGAGNAHRLLAAGITTCRVLGEPYGIDIVWKQAIASGSILGPRLVVAGNAIATTGGHAYKMAEEVDSPTEIRKAVRRQFKKGADLIKIMQTGAVIDVPNAAFGDMFSDPGEPLRFEFDQDELEVIVEVARRKGKKTSAHAHGGPGATYAILAGVNTIDHGAFLNGDQLELMAERGTMLVPTFGCYTRPEPGSPEAAIWSYLADVFDRVTESSLEVVRKARELGVKVATGTDTKHGDVVGEMEALIAAGYSPGEAIVASTRLGGECCGLPDVGTLAPGKVADLIAVSGDPLEDISVLRDVRLVMKDGSVQPV